jgi:hypothetical protein
MDETSGVFGDRVSRDVPPELTDRDRGSIAREEWLELAERSRMP